MKMKGLLPTFINLERTAAKNRQNAIENRKSRRIIAYFDGELNAYSTVVKITIRTFLCKRHHQTKQ